MESTAPKPPKIVRHNPRPSDARKDAARKNGALSHGRPRIRIDHEKWNRLFFNGVPDKEIADTLGISFRTFMRWKRQRQRDESPAE